MRTCPQEHIKRATDSNFISTLVKDICKTYEDGRGVNHIDGHNLPRESEILSIVNDLLDVVFPGYGGKETYSLNTIKFSIGEIIARVNIELYDQISRSFRYNCAMSNCDDCNTPEMAEKTVRRFLAALPEIRESMKMDVQAAFEGDPAAKNMDEIVLSYPGLKAITIQRLAHVLYHENVPLIPRMMSEYAHRLTGIDIHPGAHLGKAIFIDHGTGVVIGETAVIGDNVKIYQGVTLGALSFPKDACGKIIKGAKRHPTIEDNVTIYAGATILGDTIIGKGSIIGGNVWLTETVAPGSKITATPPDLTISHRSQTKGV